MVWAAACRGDVRLPGTECRQGSVKSPGSRPPHCRVVWAEDVTFLNLAFTSVFSAGSSPYHGGGGDSVASSFLMNE